MLVRHQLDHWTGSHLDWVIVGADEETILARFKYQEDADEYVALWEKAQDEDY